MSEKRVLERLWQEAFLLDSAVASLKVESDALFEKHKLAEAKKIPCTNPHAVEAMYWETMHRLEQKKSEYEALLRGIDAFEESGTVPEQLHYLFPKPPEVERALSKRRKAIREARAHLSAPLNADELFYATIFEPELAKGEKQACVVHRPIFMVEGVPIPQARKVRSSSGSYAAKSGGRIRKV